MTAKEFTLDDLRTILRESAGADEAVDLDDDILDTEFFELGYESLAMLETSSRIERDYGIELDDNFLSDATTPRAVLEVVNSLLAESS